MKKQIFFWILCISAFLFGMLFGVYVDFPASKSDQTELHISFYKEGKARSGKMTSYHDVMQAKEIPVLENITGKSGKIQLQKKILEKHQKKDGWERDLIHMGIYFLLPRQDKNSLVQMQEKNENIYPGDYFIYQIPENYSLGERFSSGEIRKGSHPMVRYRKAERKGREILIFTVTEYAVLYSLFGEVSGHMTLDLIQN